MLCFHHKQLPPNIHFETLNPKINIGDTPIEFVTTNTQLPSKTLHAGVSSFGFSGTLAHVVLESTAHVPTHQYENPFKNRVECITVEDNEKTNMLIAKKWRTLDSGTRSQKITSFLKTSIKNMTGYTVVSNREPIMNSGLDSLGAVDFSDNLQKEFGITTESTLLFDYSTIEELTKYISQTFDTPEIETPLLETSIETPSTSESTEIAVLGISCKLPGHVSSPESFWKLLENPKDVTVGLPLSCYENETHIYVRKVGMIDEKDLFDYDFFGIPKDSLLHVDKVDVRMKNVIEVSYLALLQGTYNKDTIFGTNTDVFIGNSYDNDTGPYLSRRLSYTLGLLGKSVTINATCASSMVALDLACQSLKNKEAKCLLLLV